MLEDGCEGHEAAEPYKKVAFLAISNWALDPAKMNRGILVLRNEPEQRELENTARLKDIFGYVFIGQCISFVFKYSLARFVTKSTIFISSKLLLNRLHWLPIGSTIDFKIATLTYKAVHLKQPPCLGNHLKLKSMRFNTRNNDQLLLQYPSVSTNSYGRRAFSHTAPTVWNKINFVMYHR